MKYFKDVKTLEELKRVYKKLALANHPDRGGDPEVMKAINAEYDAVFKMVKDVHVNAKGETYTKETAETPEEFKGIIEKLLKMGGLDIEIIGSFIWVGGNTKPHKEELKELGMRWSRNKAMWYKSPAGYRRRGKKSYNMEQIRGMYGVQDSYHTAESAQINQ